MGIETNITCVVQPPDYTGQTYVHDVAADIMQWDELVLPRSKVILQSGADHESDHV